MNKQKQIIIFTRALSQSRYEVNRALEEGQKLGWNIRHYLYKEVKFLITNNKVKLMVGDKELNSENVASVWFRVAGTTNGRYIENRNLMIRLLSRQGVFCANKDGFLNWPRMGKISQHGVFVENKIPIVSTKIFYTKEQVQNESWQYPIIVKHDMGFQGKSVFKLDNEKELEKFLKQMLEKEIGMLLWQKYLPTKWDLRIIVINGKAIGAMKRSAIGKEFRSNFSLGGSVEKWNLSNEDKEIAEKVACLCGLDYCGVDIMKDENGNSFVLEVNRQCQYKGFEKSTGINVAKQVVEMLKSSKLEL